MKFEGTSEQPFDLSAAKVGSPPLRVDGPVQVAPDINVGAGLTAAFAICYAYGGKV